MFGNGGRGEPWAVVKAGTFERNLTEMEVYSWDKHGIGHFLMFDYRIRVGNGTLHNITTYSGFQSVDGDMSIHVFAMPSLFLSLGGMRTCTVGSVGCPKMIETACQQLL